MNLEILSKNFDLIVNAHGSVPKLKKWILQLAVQGKLVAQDPNDEPASELLKKIKAEKDKLVLEKKLKKEQPFNSIKPNELPYEVPNNWEWTKLGEICFLITDGTHHTPTYIDSGVPFLSVKDVSKGFLDFSKTRYISEEEHKELTKRCNPEFGDILFTKIGTTGIAKVIDVKLDFSIFVSLSLLKISKNNIYPYFLEYLLNSPLVKKQSDRDTMGIGNKNLVLKYIKEFIIPLPPLEEQKRIVARVEQLMKLCDELEQQQKQVQEKRINFNLSATYHLSNSENQDDFNKYLQIINDNFDYLYDEPKNVAKLRGTILQLAVQGKLVVQDPNDEPASELLKKIKAEKDKLIAEGKIKKEKPLTPINPDEIPFEIPKNWEWVRLGNIGNSINYPIVDGPFGTSIDVNNDYLLSGVPIIRMANVKPYTFIYNNLKFISEEKYNELKRHNVLPNDVVFSKVGAGIGESCIIPKNFNYGLLSTTGLARFRVGEIITAQYLCYLLNLYKEKFNRIASKTAQPFLNMSTIKNVLITVPPLEEQKRIVVRVEQLMKLCDELELTIEKSRKEHDLLIQSALNASLKPLEKDLALNY